MSPQKALETIDWIRGLLKDGAVIRAVDVNEPILMELPDGIIHGGLMIDFSDAPIKEET